MQCVRYVVNIHANWSARLQIVALRKRQAASTACMRYWQYAVLRALCAHTVCDSTHREAAGMRAAEQCWHRRKRLPGRRRARWVTATDDSEAMSHVALAQTLDQP